MLDSLVFIVADIFMIMTFDSDSLSSLVNFMIRSFESLIMSESELLFHAHVNIWSQFYQSLELSHVKKFLPVVTEVFRKVIDHSFENVPYRLFLFLTRLTLRPEARLAIIYDNSLAEIVDITRNCLKLDLVQKAENLAISAYDFLVNLISISITCNQALDLRFRSATESVPKCNIEQIVLTITSILNLKKSTGRRLWLTALRVLRFACTSLCFCTEVMNFPHFSLALLQIYKSRLLTEEVTFFLIGIATELARIDLKFGLKFIGLNDPGTLTTLKGDAFNRAIVELVNTLERPRVTFVSDATLRSIQTVYGQSYTTKERGKRNHHLCRARLGPSRPLLIPRSLAEQLSPRSRKYPLKKLGLNGCCLKYSRLTEVFNSLGRKFC
jgi:hypothetical protein